MEVRYCVSECSTVVYGECGTVVYGECGTMYLENNLRDYSYPHSFYYVVHLPVPHRGMGAVYS